MTQAVRQGHGPQGTAKLRVVPDAPPPVRKPRLAQLLFDQGAITAEQMRAALVSQRHRDLPIGEILVTQGAITEARLLQALAEQTGTRLLPEDHPPPDPALAGLLPAGLAIRLNAVPLRRAGSALVVMTSRPDRAYEIRAALSNHDGPVLLALASRERMQAALTGVYGNELARIAEARTPGPYSCRDWDAPRAFRRWLAVLLAVCGALVVKVAGLSHPLDAYLTTQGYLGLAFFFVACQMLTFYAAWRAAALPRHRKLRLWIPILDVYFLLASAATLMGLAELLVKPFHWRKTAHGHFSQDGQATGLMQDQTLPASSFSRTSNAVDR